MKPATKKALLKSIKHWKENENVERVEDAKLGWVHCELCNIFFEDDCSRTTKNGAEKCPVYEATGNRGCKGTPYDETEKAYYKNNLKLFRKAAKKEREFLESLLPEEK